ncbi:MAG: hypothetical protein ACFHU9_04790 [Fluviicola sp.]
MKTLSTLGALFLLTFANAQSTTSVAYEVDTQTSIQSLRLSIANGNEKSITPYSIGDFQNTKVCLHLNPALDYELLVNNTKLIQISSAEIRSSIKSSEETSPVSLVSMENWVITEE